MKNPFKLSVKQWNLKHAVLFVALANLFYFFVEFHMARVIDSVSLFADSIDFLEDAAVNSIVLMSLFLATRSKYYVSILLAMMLLLPISAAFFTAWEKLYNPIIPASSTLSFTALGALAVNLICAFILAKFKDDDGSLSRAAFLSSRNDAIANMAIICAALVSLIWVSFWPDLMVGIGIAIINLDSAKEILQAAQHEKNRSPKRPD